MSDPIIESLNAIREDQREMRQSLAEVAKAMTRLAIVEERQSNTQNSLARAFKFIEDHDERISVLEKSEPEQKRATEWVNKAVWGFAAAAAGFMGSKLMLLL